MSNTERIRQEIERRIGAMYNFSSGYSALNVCRELLDFIDSLPKGTVTDTEQTRKEGSLEYWLEYFGMPKENIENCITQIAQGYGACRYLEGVQHGAEAVKEIAKEEVQEIRGEVVKDRRGKLIVRASGIRDDLLLGDKVKIYVLKEDQK